MATTSECLDGTGNGRPVFEIPQRKRHRLVRVLLAAVVLVVSLGGLAMGGDVSRANAIAADSVVQSPVAVSNDVYVGVYIYTVQQIDMEHHLYTVDFQLWFRWTNPDFRPVLSVDFINEADWWATVIEVATKEPVVLQDGSFYQREHVQARFSTNFTIEHYPFDHLSFPIVMEDKTETASHMHFLADDPGADTAPNLSVPGYRVGQPTLKAVTAEYPELGVTGQGTRSVSRVIVAIPMTRPWLPYALKIFVPFLVVILCSALIFFISPNRPDVRFALGVSALLTLVALKWTTDAQLPLVDFVGMIDWLYLIGFVFVGFTLAESTYVTWHQVHGAEIEVLERFDHRMLMISAAIFVVAAAVVVFCVG